MGIDIGSKLLVGMSYKKAFDGIDPNDEDGEAWDTIDDLGMVACSPWYDADIDDCFIGFEVSDSISMDELDSVVDEIKSLSVKFEGITGKIPKLIAVADVW